MPSFITPPLSPLSAILERNDVGSVRWDTWPVLALVGGFSAAQFLFYVVAPAVIRVTSATALNLALFTADFYILITGIALFKFKVGEGRRCWPWEGRGLGDVLGHGGRDRRGLWGVLGGRGRAEGDKISVGRYAQGCLLQRRLSA